MEFKLLASRIAESLTGKPLINTNPVRLSSEFERSDEELTERRKWVLEIEWMASLSLSCKSHIFSKTHSISSTFIFHVIWKSSRICWKMRNFNRKTVKETFGLVQGIASEVFVEMFIRERGPPRQLILVRNHDRVYELIRTSQQNCSLARVLNGKGIRGQILRSTCT